MKEIATHEKIDAMYDVFSSERLRWLIGKGDLLMQKGELEMEHLQELIIKTVQQEHERSMILRSLGKEAKSITEISKDVQLDPSDVFRNIIALTKWNMVEVSEQKGCEYLYSVRETSVMTAD